MKIKIQDKLPIADCRLPIFQKVGARNFSIANRQSPIANAFTLVEMMLVVVIIGILAALVIPKIAGQSERARLTAAQADIRGGIKSAIDQFEVDNGHYPKSLQDLLQQPHDANNWHGPYFDPPQIPVDPWGNPYFYSYPGKHNANSYDLWSAGPDGKSGTDDDIGNWPTTTK